MIEAPAAPPTWSDAELEADRRVAMEAFRAERIREPLKTYLDTFDERRRYFEDLIDWLLGDADPAEAPIELVTRVLTSKGHLEALRYLAAPPISSDDLQILAEARTLSPSLLRGDPACARLVYRTVMQGLDARRFPWVGIRPPTAEERATAVTASAALLATHRTETVRRSEGKTAQEKAVFAALDAMGFARQPARVIQTLDQAPPPGHYCSESMLGGRKADVVVRLWDRRVLAVECKVTNSEKNSIKRLNNDAAVKAVQWLHEFGVRQLVPSAMLSGVFKLHKLGEAQRAGLTLWWAHDLARFADWVARTKS